VRCWGGSDETSPLFSLHASRSQITRNERRHAHMAQDLMNSNESFGSTLSMCVFALEYGSGPFQKTPSRSIDLGRWTAWITKKIATWASCLRLNF
jgi:hypothetical protein